MKIFVKNTRLIFEEFIKRGTVSKDKLRMNTDWKTHEFGFHDLNKNVIFIVEDVQF